ncbi:MAG: SDR family oxidoreductase [Ferruginibacter sp.]
MNIIITGASRGIGKAIAVAFNQKNNRLILCARNKTALNETATALKQTKAAEVEIFSADLSIKTETEAFAQFCLGFGIPGILINNAGVYIAGNVADEHEGSLEKMMDTNLYSAYHLTRALLPSMIKNASGHIFNICSVASLQPYEGGGGYSISKYAMNGFSQNLRHELKDKGIKVTTVFPGAVMTDSWAGFNNSDKRIMEAIDIAQMIYAASLLSPQAVVEDLVLRPQKGDL